jgi:hypothetical protein
LNATTRPEPKRSSLGPHPVAGVVERVCERPDALGERAARVDARAEQAARRRDAGVAAVLVRGRRDAECRREHAAVARHQPVEDEQPDVLGSGVAQALAVPLPRLDGVLAHDKLAPGLREPLVIEQPAQVRIGVQEHGRAGVRHLPEDDTERKGTAASSCGPVDTLRAWLAATYPTSTAESTCDYDA